MPDPAAVVKARVVEWRPVVKAGGTVKQEFKAGKATVKADVQRFPKGNPDQGMDALEQRLIAAVSAAQSPKTEIEVQVKAEEKLGIVVSTLVRGPD